MGDIAQLDSRRPSVSVYSPVTDRVYFVPILFFERFADSEDVLDLTDPNAVDMLRAAVNSWLVMLEES